MAETIIRVSHLKKCFKETKAVDDISFEIKKGELFGFLGINGAGKSTTINMLSTLSAPTEARRRSAVMRLEKKTGRFGGGSESSIRITVWMTG